LYWWLSERHIFNVKLYMPKSNWRCQISKSRQWSTTDDTDHLEKRFNEAEQANEELAAMVKKIRRQIKELISLDRDDSRCRSPVRAAVLETELQEVKLQIESLLLNAKSFQTACESSSRVLEEKDGHKGTCCRTEQHKKSVTKEQKLSDTLTASHEKLEICLSDVENEQKETSSYRQKLLSENASFKKQRDSVLEEIREKKRLTYRCTQIEENL
jgi:hypothetical protein